MIVTKGLGVRQLVTQGYGESPIGLKVIPQKYGIGGAGK